MFLFMSLAWPLHARLKNVDIGTFILGYNKKDPRVNRPRGHMEHGAASFGGTGAILFYSGSQWGHGIHARRWTWRWELFSGPPLNAERFQLWALLWEPFLFYVSSFSLTPRSFFNTLERMCCALTGRLFWCPQQSVRVADAFEQSPPELWAPVQGHWPASLSVTR